MLLIVLMISKKANYLSEEDEDIMTEIPKEFIKTTFAQKSKTIRKKMIGGFVVDMRKKISKEVMDRIQSSEVKYFVHLNEQEEENLREYFVN